MKETEAVERVRGEIGRVVRDLEATRDWLQGLAESLPASQEEADPDRDLATLDEAGALRATLQCVLRDRLEMALKDLRGASKGGAK
ncbi:MAG TPA: hypothetical protein VJ725_16325 [Thermoanaerobaculia bacterium]|nr:hypothetical protein [Thermoanaerobaculia bacterium]